MSETSGYKGTSRKGAKHHTSQIVAQALALLVLGSSVAEVSEKLQIPSRTISEWKALLPEQVAEGRPKKELIEDLFGQYLEKSLLAILAQLDVISDPNWIRSQTAGELATLHGVVFDKSVRVFDAARRGAELREQRQLSASTEADGTSGSIS